MTGKINRHLSEKDEIIRGIIENMELPKIESTQNVFHDLMSCIIEQQIHYRSTKKFFQKRMEKSGLEILTPENFEVFEERGLYDTKLSARKFETINRTVEFFEKNKINWQKLEAPEVRKLLKEIKGIGTWTQDMILIYTLGKSNIFPADDFHLKNMMTTLYGLDASSRLKAQMKEVANNWSPYQSFGTRYLLAWKEFKKKK